MAVALRRSALWRPFLACIVVFSPFSAHAVLEAREKEDVYLGIYALGSLPVNTNVILAGMEGTGTAVGKGGGAGIQVAIFPAFTNRMVGVELEYFAHGATLSFPLASGPGTGTSDLVILNSMINLLFRYPGRVIQPYIGIGAGTSQAIVVGSNIPGRTNKDFETSLTLGYQFIGGLQGNLSERTFLFSEYKHLAADYHWSKLSLDFRSHYVIVGIGLRF